MQLLDLLSKSPSQDNLVEDFVPEPVDSNPRPSDLNLPSSGSSKLGTGELGQRMKRDAVNGADKLEYHSGNKYC